MITLRARMFLIAAFAFYLFANQTQVGWLYVMSALLAGTVLTGLWAGRGVLRKITGTRRIGSGDDAELYEGDLLNIELTLHTIGRNGAAQVRAVESCPLVPPDDPKRNMSLFIPSLSAGEAVRFNYEVTVDRRGVHEFPVIQLSTQAPFGFLHQRRELPIKSSILVYPEVRPIHQLDLLDRQLSPQIPRPKSGSGYEVIGVRPFRSGDSPRHIHWRSVARTGQLISKEFADEVQPGLSLVLDLYQHDYPQTETKHTPFEWVIKCAASIGDYSFKRNYPLYLAADDDVLAVPTGPISRWAMLQYLAKVQPSGERRLAKVISSRNLQSFVAVMISWPDPTIRDVLVDLHHQHFEVLAVVIEPRSFPVSGLSASGLVDDLRMAGIMTRHIKFGSDWTVQLAEQPEPYGVREKVEA